MPTKIISAQPYSIKEYLFALKKYGFLIAVLSKRELKIKYSGTLVGLGWLFLQPLVVVTVYSIFFSYIIKIHTDNIPYPSFVFSGLVLWYIFTGVVSKGTSAFVESTDLVSKVAFPKLILLISKTIPVVLECFILFLLLFVLLIFSHQQPGFNSFTSLFYIAQVTIFSLSVGLICSMIALKYRDLIHVLPFIMNFAIWLTPVFYSASIVPEPFQHYLRYVNPLALSMEGLRGALFFDRSIPVESYILFVVSCLLFLICFYYFVKFDKKIAEKL